MPADVCERGEGWDECMIGEGVADGVVEGSVALIEEDARRAKRRGELEEGPPL